MNLKTFRPLDQPEETYSVPMKPIDCPWSLQTPFILGREKQKSKSISNTVNPKWRESFDFYWYEELDSFMEITIWDKDVGSKDDFMGR